MHSEQKTFLWSLIGAFVFLGFLIYGQSLTNGFVRWDDGLLIYENPAIRGISFSNLKTVFTSYDPELYIPLTLVSYQFDYMMSGTNAAFYHFHSLVYHIANALLVVWFTFLLCKKRWIAVVAGLLFLLHPLHTEAVAWASGRKDVLSAFWMLLTLIFYERYRQENVARWFHISIAAFAIGLLCKVTILTVPALLLLIDFYTKRPWKWKLIVPYALLALLFGVIAYFGKTGVIDSSTTLEKILIAPMSAVFYVQKLILPYGLAVIYPFTGSVELFSARIAIPLLLCLVLMIVGCLSIQRYRIIFFSLAFFAITLSPSLLNFSKGDFLYFASDRYAYIPSIGILFLVASLAHSLYQRNSRATLFGTFGIVIILSVLSFKQSLVWADSETLFTNNIHFYPEAHTAHNNLGNIYRTKGQIEKSIASYEEALRLSKEFGRGEQALYGQAKILSNLASAKRTAGDASGAMATLAEAEELDPKNPHISLQKGISYATAGNALLAEQAYKNALELRPHFTTAEVNLGSLYMQTGNSEQAIEVLESAISYNPFYPQAYYNLAAAYRAVGRQREGLEAYEQAVELEPAFVAARINLGILYAERKRIDDAIEQFSEVLKYDPQNARAQSALQQLGVR